MDTDTTTTHHLDDLGLRSIVRDDQQDQYGILDVQALMSGRRAITVLAEPGILHSGDTVTDHHGVSMTVCPDQPQWPARQIAAHLDAAARRPYTDDAANDQLADQARLDADRAVGREAWVLGPIGGRR